MEKLQRIVESWHLNWWRVGTVCFFGCFAVSTLCFLMLAANYEHVKDMALRQQTEIIDVQSTIIKQQHEIISGLTGDNTTPDQVDRRKALPAY